MKNKVIIVLLVLVVGLGIFMLWPEGNKRYLPDTLKKAAELLYRGEYDSSMAYAHRVLSSAKNKNNIAYSQNVLGYCWSKKGNLDSAYHYYSKSLAASNSADSMDFELKVSTLNSLGRIFEKYQQHKKAIQYFKRAIEILEVYESENIAKAYFNLAYNQSRINDIECVRSYYKALEFSTKYENPYLETLCLNDLGLLMLETDNFESAIEYFNMSLVSEYTKSNLKYQAFAYQGMGEGYFYMEDYKHSEESLLKSLDIKKKLDNKKYLFTANLFLGRLYNRTKDLEKSENFYKATIEHFPLVDLTRENIAVFKELSEIQTEMGKLEESHDSNVRYYAEIENYLDYREKAAQLAKQDQFDTTVAVTEAQYRIRDKWELLKEDWNWGLIFKIAAIIYILICAFITERLIREARRSFGLQLRPIQRVQ